MKLEEHPFIRSISLERQRALLPDVTISDLSDGDVIFCENTAPDALILILAGNVAFTKEKPDGSLQYVSQSGEGSFFGEVGVFTGELRALGAVAAGPCSIATIPEVTVKKILEDAEPIRRILESVIQHLKSTTDHYMDEVMRTEKLSLVGSMASSLLHDFKNPFAIIRLGSNIIAQEHKDHPQTAKICANIDLQVTRMINMANDLGAYSRGDSHINPTVVNLNTLFADFRELNTPFFADQAIQVQLQGSNISAFADPVKLLRVLQNLVNNAIEAIQSKDVRGRVTVSASEDADSVVIYVKDDGPGIPEEIQDKFFDPFVTVGKSEGTGLGTAIVKSIVEAHDGEIHFTTGSEGTTFTVTLPKAKQ